MNLFDKCMDVVNQTLKQKKLNPDDIDEVILSGGATKMPKIRKLLEEKFESKIFHETDEPGEVQAYGAAFCAATYINKVKAKPIDPKSEP